MCMQIMQGKLALEWKDLGHLWCTYHPPQLNNNTFLIYFAPKDFGHANHRQLIESTQI